jgi:hypothetical protein
LDKFNDEEKNADGKRNKSSFRGKNWWIWL